jgi:hypothetical protein
LNLTKWRTNWQKLGLLKDKFQIGWNREAKSI